MATGILGTKNLYVNASQSIYVCDKSGGAIVSLNVCNKSNVSAFISVAVGTTVNTINNNEYIEYNLELKPKGVLERSSIALAVGQHIIVKSDQDLVNAVVWGIEVGNSVAVTAITNNDIPAWNTSFATEVFATTTVSSKAALGSNPFGLTYNVTSGALPTGLSLSSSTGLISGTVSTSSYVVGGVPTSATITATGGSTPYQQVFNITRKWYDGSTAALAGTSAAQIKSDTGLSATGYYWIKPRLTSTAYQVHCDMSNSGGGWMLMSFCAQSQAAGVHVEDAYTGSAFNMGSSSTSITSTNQAIPDAGNMGQAFIDALVVAGRSRGVAVFRVEDGGTSWLNWYFALDSNARWYPIANRGGCTIGKDWVGNNWLFTTYTGYTADAGNNGAGSMGGSSYGYNNENWCSFPGNFNGHSSNWGYSIHPYYNQNSFAYPGWNSAHSSGWGRRASFWLKVV